MRALTVLQTVPRAPLWLGLGGALPFAACLVAYAAGGLWIVSQALALKVMLAYGAVILSFLGGIRWGLALRLENADRRDARFALSILPSLLGWVALLLPSFPALVLLAVAFAAQGAWDVGDAGEDGAPAWFATLRSLLTALVCSFLSVMAVLTVL